MSIIIRKGFRLADPLAAVFCMMIFLFAAPITAAHAEGTEGGRSATRVLKKKVAFTQFNVANTQHVDDISNIYDGLPAALSSRLAAGGELLSGYTGRSIPAEEGTPQREAVIRLAEEAGAQFLVSGTVMNAGITRIKGFWGTTVKRHIEVELAVYDGLTGARLLLRRLDEQAEGDVMVGNNKPFGSSIFFETELGKATDRLIDSAVKDIRAALKNVPFSAHIIQAEGKRILINAGRDSLLRPGDILVAYARDTGTIAGLKGSMPGVTDRAVDTVVLTQVQAQFSVGELSEDAEKLGVKAGNIARIDPDEQRNLVAKRIAAQQIAKAQQEAKEEAERVKAEQAAQAEAARAKAKQAAKDEADRIKAEKKAQAEAKKQAAAEAKASKLNARTVRGSAAQEAQIRARAQAAKLKARQETRAEAERIKAEKKAKADVQPAAKTGAAKLKQEAKTETGSVPAEQTVQVEAEAKDAKAKAKSETKAKAASAMTVKKDQAQADTGAAAKPARTKAVPKDQAKMEVRAVAVEDMQRAAEAEAKAGAEKPKAESGVAETKPAAPLKLKQIKP